MPVSVDVMWTDDFAEGKDKNVNKHSKGSCELPDAHIFLWMSENQWPSCRKSDKLLLLCGKRPVGG